MKNRPGSGTYWRALGRAFLTIFLASILGLAGYIAYLSARTAQSALHPPRIPLSQTPRSVGISEYQDVAFTTADHILLKGWYMPPRPGNGQVILLFHGYAGNRQILLPEAGMLSNHGFGVLMIDFRGHGESGDALVTIGENEQNDVRAALDWAASQPGVRGLSGLGFSMGGAALAMAASRDTRLSSVVIEAAFPTLDAELWFRARVFGWLSQLPAVWVTRGAGVDPGHVRPLDALCAISPRPVLLIYGEHDGDVPPGTPQAMRAAACSPAELWLVPGAGHQNYAEIDPAEYEQRLVDWFQR